MSDFYQPRWPAELDRSNVKAPPADPNGGADSRPDMVLIDRAMTTIDRVRFEASKAALTGLLASTPATTQAISNFDHYATRAVRYADALIEALNRSTEEAAHARRR
jgi:hypothetical protein